MKQILLWSLALSLLLAGCSSKVGVQVQSRDSYKSFAVAGTEAFLPKGDFKANIYRGKQVFKENCAICHVDGSKRQAGKTLIRASTIRTQTPMELFKFISGEGLHGENRRHPKSFDQALSINDRWNVIFYARSFYSKKPMRKGFEEKFGQNCAICHGKRGYGDGPLARKLYPEPANFTQLSRLYNRTDEYLYQRITDGAYPTAMPPWKDVEGTKDPAERWRFVDYVRAFSYVESEDHEVRKGLKR